MFDENDVVLYNEYEEPRSVEPDDIADCTFVISK